MRYDIYKIIGKDEYVFVETGVDVTKIDMKTDVELVVFKEDHDITSRPGLIGAETENIVADIKDIGFSIQGAKVISQTT
jgi:hypothetical protein